MANEERVRNLKPELLEVLGDAISWISTAPIPEAMVAQRRALVTRIDALRSLMSGALRLSIDIPVEDDE